MNKHVALIGGITGAVGSALARELCSRNNWEVHGLSRNAPTRPIEGVNYGQLNLNVQDSLQTGLSAFKDVTHLFYCGRATHAEQVLENAEDNLRLLDHLVCGVETFAENLEHVHLVQGGKYYGVHVGPFPTPAREEDSRAPIPNFNYDQQDYLDQRSKNRKWSWSASRPNTLLHYSPQISRNIVSTLGVYAAICRELGASLDFPGNPGAFESITQMTTIELLAKGIAWMVTEKSCLNQAFNFTNTDVFRWKHLWPRIAECFDMVPGSVRPLKLEEVMSERDEVWKSIAKKFGLKTSSLDQVANWGFADATLERYWDEILSHNKCRSLGFHEWDETETRFVHRLKQYQNSAILPT